MAPPPSPSCAETRESKGGAAQPVLSAGPACGRRGLGAAAAGRWWTPARPRYSRAPPKFASHSRRAAEPGAQETGKFGGLRLPRPAPGAGRRGVAGGGMAREPKEEETVRPTALVRRCPRCPDWPGAPRPPLWLLCVVACWILGAVADADFSILDEAQVLASQMRRLAAEELGVVTMQVRDSLRRPTCSALRLHRAPGHCNERSCRLRDPSSPSVLHIESSLSRTLICRCPPLQSSPTLPSTPPLHSPGPIM